MNVQEFNPQRPSSNRQTDCPTAQPLRVWIPPILVGLLLLAAASLKTIDLFNGSVSTHLFRHLVEILMETAMGLWLVWGRGARICAMITLVLFTVFAGVSAFRGIAGYHSCGCFGPVHVNPWLTMTLDVVVVLVMLWSLRVTPAAGSNGRLRKAAAMLLAIVMVWVGIWGQQYWQPAFLHANGQITGGHGLLFTTPPSWYGHTMPISPFIVGSNALLHGRWLVIIYYHGCPVCQQAIASITRHYRQKKPKNIRVALVELPPWGHLPRSMVPGAWLRLKLSNHFIWRINPAIPMLVNVRSGQVTRVRVFVPRNWRGF